ncbi:MAG TPA: ABC transporter permease [Coriobacteriia bacterium]
MNFAESFRIAMRALAANKARSFLTMLGVIIGVAAVILLVSIGSGVQSSITSQIEGLGSNLLFVFPGQLEGGRGGPGGGGGLTKRFTLEDAKLLRNRLQGASFVAPAAAGAVTARFENRTAKGQLIASDENIEQVGTYKIATGRWYRRSEVDGAARVVQLGSAVTDQLFPNTNPIGKEVSVNGQRFRVIATMQKIGGGFGGSQDTVVYMPVTTAQRLTGSTDIAEIIVKVTRSEDVNQVRAQIKRLFKPRFGAEFTVFSQEQTLSLLGNLLGTLTVMLAGIAGISLVVGGIGIMNIMLVSVSERTREIGIRKAVGARTYDILSQFIIEAVMLSVTGGLVGIAIGAGGAAALKSVVPTEVTWWSVALAFFFAAAVGVFFGAYPAYRASKLDPIVALRYE